MPNITGVLNDQIRRLAKREINARTRSTRRLTTQHRRDLAALKRTVATLQKTVGFLESQEKRRVGQQPVPGDADGLRFQAGGLKSHRAKLGLSAKDYGRLVGVSGLSIYHWERAKSRPGRKQLPKLAAVRGIGKREAAKRLELLGDPDGQTRGRRRKVKRGRKVKRRG